MRNKKIFESLHYARNQVIFSYRIKKIIHGFLGSIFITGNPLYRHFYIRNVYQNIPALERLPHWIIIENTNLCNLSCIFCPNEGMERKKGVMREDLLRSIIDQAVRNNIPNVLIQGFGEPLLDKDYIARVAYAKKKGVQNVHCVTNGVLLSEDISEGLIKAGLDYIYISIDAASPEVYGQIHKVPGSAIPSNKFPDVIKNIDSLISLKKKLKSVKPILEVRFKDFDVNKNDLYAFIARYKRSVDKVNIFMNIFNWPGSGIKNNLPQNTHLLKFPCKNLWSGLYVTVEGKVALCCQDYECKIELGDTNKENIMDIWNGEVLKKYRTMHLDCKFNEIPACRECIINSQLLSPWWGAG